MDDDQLNDEPPSIPIPEKIPFPWFTLAAVMCTVLGVVLMITHQQRRRSQDDFRYDSLGAEQYRFDLHPSTDYYQTFKATFPEDAVDKRPLQRALLERAMHNTPLVLRLSQEANSIGALYNRSMISESAWKAFQDSEEILRQEMDNVREEAEELNPGWGQVIWQQAVNLYNKSEELKKQAAHAEEERKTQAIRAKREKQKEKAKAKKAANAPTKEELAEKARLELEALLAEEDENRRIAALEKKPTSKKGSKKNR